MLINDVVSFEQPGSEKKKQLSLYPQLNEGNNKPMFTVSHRLPHFVLNVKINERLMMILNQFMFQASSVPGYTGSHGTFLEIRSSR